MPSDWKEIMTGLKERDLSTGYCHLRIHYTADPRKDAAWARKKSLSYGGMDNPKWRREFELDYSAVEGQRVYPMLSETHLIHLMLDYRMTQEYSVHRIIDYGLRHPTVCLWVSVNAAGDIHIFREYYAVEKTIEYNCQEILRRTQEPIVSTWIDPATRQRIPLSQTNFAPTSIYDEFVKGLRCPIRFADNSESGYDKVRRALLSTLARQAHAEAVSGESYFARNYFDSFGIQPSEFLAMAEHPALTISPACPRVFRELKNLRFAELTGSPSDKAAPEQIMDFEDDGPDCVRYAVQSKLKFEVAEYVEVGSPLWEARQIYEQNRRSETRIRRPGRSKIVG